MEELNKIKKLLPNMVSADLELVIQMATRQLRLACVKEVDRMFRLALDPKTIKLLKKELNKE